MYVLYCGVSGVCSMADSLVCSQLAGLASFLWSFKLYVRIMFMLFVAGQIADFLQYARESESSVSGSITPG